MKARLVVVSLLALIALVSPTDAFAVEVPDGMKTRILPCAINGYWYLQLRWTPSTCGTCGQDDPRTHLQLLVDPKDDERTAERARTDGKREFAVIEEGDTGEVLSAGMGRCLATLRVRPDFVNPWTEQLELTLLVDEGVVTGLGSARFYNNSETTEVGCVRFFSVMGKVYRGDDHKRFRALQQRGGRKTATRPLGTKHI